MMAGDQTGDKPVLESVVTIFTPIGIIKPQELTLMQLVTMHSPERSGSAWFTYQLVSIIAADDLVPLCGSRASGTMISTILNGIYINFFAYMGEVDISRSFKNLQEFQPQWKMFPVSDQSSFGGDFDQTLTMIPSYVFSSCCRFEPYIRVTTR